MASPLALRACLPLLLMSLALAPQAAAAPTTILTDPAGDATALLDALGTDHLDILSATIDSDGTNAVFVLEFADLRTDMPTSAVGIWFHVVTASDDVWWEWRCVYGDLGTPVDEAIDLAQGATCSAGSEDGDSLLVARDMDFTAETYTVVLPYADLGAASGDHIADIDAHSAERIGIYEGAGDSALAPAFSYALA